MFCYNVSMNDVKKNKRSIIRLNMGKTKNFLCKKREFGLFHTKFWTYLKKAMKIVFTSLAICTIIPIILFFTEFFAFRDTNNFLCRTQKKSISAGSEYRKDDDLEVGKDEFVSAGEPGFGYSCFDLSKLSFYIKTIKEPVPALTRVGNKKKEPEAEQNPAHNYTHNYTLVQLPPLEQDTPKESSRGCVEKIIPYTTETRFERGFRFEEEYYPGTNGKELYCDGKLVSSTAPSNALRIVWIRDSSTSPSEEIRYEPVPPKEWKYEPTKSKVNIKKKKKYDDY